MVTRLRSPAGPAVETGVAGTTASSSKPLPVSYTYVVAAVVLAVLFWVVESLIHVAIFREGTFESQLVTIDPHEIWKRLLFGAIIIVFGEHNTSFVFTLHGTTCESQASMFLPLFTPIRKLYLHSGASCGSAPKSISHARHEANLASHDVTIITH